MKLNPHSIEQFRKRIENRLIQHLERILIVGHKRLNPIENGAIIEMYTEKIINETIDEVTVLFIASELKDIDQETEDIVNIEKELEDKCGHGNPLDDCDLCSKEDINSGQTDLLQENEAEPGQQQTIVPLVCSNCHMIRRKDLPTVDPGESWTCEPCNYTNSPLVETKEDVDVRSPEKEPYGKVEKKPPQSEWDIGASDRAATELYKMLEEHPEGVLQQDLVERAGVSTAVASRVVNMLIDGSPVRFQRYADKSKLRHPRGIRMIHTPYQLPDKNEVICPDCGTVYLKPNKEHTCRKESIASARKKYAEKKKEEKP